MFPTKQEVALMVFLSDANIILFISWFLGPFSSYSLQISSLHLTLCEGVPEGHILLL